MNIKELEILFERVSKTKLNNKTRKNLYEDIKSVLVDKKDIDVYNSPERSITFLGVLTDILKNINNNVVLVYRCKEVLDSIERDWFGFVYVDNSYYLNYFIDLSYCFRRRKNHMEPFECDILKPYLDFTLRTVVHYNKVKNIIGLNFYNTLTTFMLEETNNKIKNAIHKVF